MALNRESFNPPSGLGRLGVYGPILGRLPLRVFSIGKYAFQKKARFPSRPCLSAGPHPPAERPRFKLPG